VRCLDSGATKTLYTYCTPTGNDGTTSFHALRSAVRATTTLLLFGYFVLGLMSCTRGLVPAPRPLRRADVIVVLGNRPPVDAEGNVMSETRRRVEAGVALYDAGLATELLMTGGPAPHDRIEAEVMRDLAIELGVPHHERARPLAGLPSPWRKDYSRAARRRAARLADDGA